MHRTSALSTVDLHYHTTTSLLLTLIHILQNKLIKLFYHHTVPWICSLLLSLRYKPYHIITNKVIISTASPLGICSTMSGESPTIGVDVFKDLINDMKNDLKADLGTKIDNINTRLNHQDQKLSDLGQRVESLEKHITSQHNSYSEAAKSPPKPHQSSTNVNTTLSTLNSTSTSSLQNIVNSTPYPHAQLKNHDLTAEEIMHRSKHIIGIYPITTQDIERNKSDTNTKTLINTATEFLQYELGFRLEQIAEMQINKVTKTKKPDGKTLYITFPDYTSVTQIFKRTALIKNDNLKISNYVAPHFYNRYNTL